MVITKAVYIVMKKTLKTFTAGDVSGDTSSFTIGAVGKDDNNPFKGEIGLKSDF